MSKKSNGRWSKEYLEELRVAMARDRDLIDEAHAIALPAVLEDQERFLAQIEEHQGAHSGAAQALPRRGSQQPTTTEHTVHSGIAVRFGWRSDRMRRADGAGLQAFPSNHELPPEWFDGALVTLHFDETAAGTWSVWREGICEKLLLEVFAADQLLWSGSVGTEPVELSTDVEPSSVTSIVLSLPSEDNE